MNEPIALYLQNKEDREAVALALYRAGYGEKTTDFIDVVAWRGTAEFVSRFFAKGRMAVVVGSLQIRAWEDKEGNKRRTAEVIAESVYFGDSKRDPLDKLADDAAPVAPAGEFAELDDDGELPF